MKYPIALLLGLSFLFTGCMTKDAFTASGIPQREYYVGGGFSYSFVAPEAGMLYVVDENTQRVLKTKHLDAGTLFEDESLADERQRKNDYSVKTQDPKISLYFVPISKITPPTPVLVTEPAS